MKQTRIFHFNGFGLAKRLLGRSENGVPARITLPVLLALSLMLFPIHTAAYTSVTEVSPFELDAGTVSADDDVLGPNDWGIASDGSTMYGPGSFPFVDGGTVFYSGIQMTRVVYSDGWDDGSCPIRPVGFGTDPTKQEEDAYQQGDELGDNPWNDPTTNLVNSKPDMCYIYSAYEWVEVPTINAGNVVGSQDHLLFYLAIDRNTSATGNVAFSIPIFPYNTTRTGGELMIDFEISPSGSIDINLLEWDAINDEWIVAETATDKESMCALRADTKFMECILDATELGIVPETSCLQEPLGAGGVISRSSSSYSAQLQDFSGVQDPDDPNPRVVESCCGDIKIKKTTVPFIEANRPELHVYFPYAMAQTDSKPVHETVAPFTLSYTGGNNIWPSSYSNAGDSIEADSAGENLLGYIQMPTYDTDFWQNVIAQPDYFLEENPNFILDVHTDDNYNAADRWINHGTSPSTISCTYTDIMDMDPNNGPFIDYFDCVEANDGNPAGCENLEPRVTRLVYPVVGPQFVFKIVPNPVFNVPVTPTECTITNESDWVPVTIGYFHAQRSNEGILFDWSTLTETGNIGFYLNVKDEWGEWQQLDFVPSKGGNTTAQRSYSHEVPYVSGNIFSISEVETSGFTRVHGPFELNKSYGTENPGTKEIDWQTIRRDHNAKKEARESKRMQRLEQRMKKIEKSHNPRKSRQVKKNWVNRLLSGLSSLAVGSAHAADAPVRDTGLMQFKVSESGIYRVTFEELAAAGLDLNGVNPNDIALTNRGEPVPIRVQISSTGGGSYIEFIGDGLNTLYTDTNVYVLYLDASKAVRVVEYNRRPGRGTTPKYYMETVRVEPQNSYDNGSPNGDPWYAARMLANGRAYEKSLTINVDAYVQGTAPVTVSVGMWGVTDFPADTEDHHVQLFFNGQTLADEWFDGLVNHPVSETTTDLMEGINSLTIRLPFDTGQLFDLVNLDHWSVTYPRRFLAKNGGLIFSSAGDRFKVRGLTSKQIVVYRVRSNGTVEHLSRVITRNRSDGTLAIIDGIAEEQATYIVSVSDAVKSVGLEVPPEAQDITSGSAQYLVISHPDFISGVDGGMTEAMSLLVAEREGQNFAVKVIDVEQIYAQFGYGIFDAEAIRDYIAFAYDNMETEMVHLVGGDTYDYRNYLGRQAMSFIPSLYAQTDHFVKFAPVDPKYADINGDNMPDLVIGRTPVRTSEEFLALTQKTIQYQQHSNAGVSVFAADKSDGRDYGANSDSVIALMPEEWRDNAARVYVDQYLADPNLGAAAARTDLIDAINSNVALTSYMGHSATKSWGSSLFSGTDAGNLQNTSPTVVAQWGCWNTYYVSPSENSMAHELMLNSDPGLGAAVVLGASTLTVASHEKNLARELFKVLFESGKPIGQAVLEAKQAYVRTYANNHLDDHLDVILGWQHLGDPALVIQK
jgi:Peptidase family C25